MNATLLGALLPYLHVVLSVLGLACVVAAAFTVAVGVGLLAAGVALLVLAFYIETERVKP